MASSYLWPREFHNLYEKAVALYRQGNRDPESYFTSDETAFLASIGMRPINLYDYAEDGVATGEPDWDTVLLIVAARRDYFLHHQHGITQTSVTEADALPSKTAELEDIPWLPRIIAKARCFLEGGLCHEIMFCCAGDRRFLTAHDIPPADFLRAIRASGGDDQKILAFVKRI